MEQKSMTALISAFSRAYHHENNEVKIFNDSVARLLLTNEEYNQISTSMSDGIEFFNPSFIGNKEEALRWIVDNQLSPTPLARGIFAEKALETAVYIGARQYLIFAAGYDTFAYRQPDWANRLQIFELDHIATGNDKRERLKNANIEIPNNMNYMEADFTKEKWKTALTNNTAFDRNRISFCSMLGLVYYLSERVFEQLICDISSITSKGSSIIFDYPCKDTNKTEERAKKQSILASGANEKMLVSYSYREIEELLSAYGFNIYEHITPVDMTEQYFSAYNRANPSHPITAFENINYCLAVKK